MDYTLAALKVFASHLAFAVPAAGFAASSPSSITMKLFGVSFQRAWLQGVIVSADYASGDGRLLLDDGSGVTDLFLCSADSQGQHWQPGMFVMIVGPYVAAETGSCYPVIKVHKIVDLSAQPDREAMWNMEVVEANKLFYLPSLVF